MGAVLFTVVGRKCDLCDAPQPRKQVVRALRQGLCPISLYNVRVRAPSFHARDHVIDQELTYLGAYTGELRRCRLYDLLRLYFHTIRTMEIAVTLKVGTRHPITCIC